MPPNAISTTASHLAVSHVGAARLSTPDLVLVALYLIGITLFGLRFRRTSKQGSSLKSYFLADNTIPWWAIALSIVSAETSTLTIISIPGVAFAGDLGFLQVVLGYMLGRVVVALLFLPRYFRGEMLTAYQLIDQRFGHTLHKLTAGLFLLTRAAAEGVRVFAISIVVGLAIGTGDILSIGIISALTLLYTFEGGMAAVIWTDVVQMALYVAGTLVALWSIGHQTPGGWSHIHAVAAPLGKFHMLNFALNLTQSYTFWAGLLGGTFLTMASHGTDQLMVQRMLAARNLRESRLALLSSGAVIFLQFTLFLLIGVGLFVFYGAGLNGVPHFKTNDYIFPTFIVQQMPHGVAGLLVAAILAAAMSNLSAALNSLASTTVIDFLVPWRTQRLNRRPRAPFIASSAMSGNAHAQTATTDQQTTLLSRFATVFWAIVLFAIAVYAIQHGGKGHVVETGLSIASVAYGCLLGVFLLGTLTHYATQTGAILGMICGLALNLTLWQAPSPMHLGLLTIPKIAFTWYVLIGSAATFLIGSVFSLILPRKRATLAILLLLVATTSGAPSFAQLAKGGVPSEARPSLESPPTSYDFTPASTLITDAIARHKLPGAVLLVGHQGKIVFEHAYGNRALEPTVEPMTEDTLFDMASLSKVLVTTTAILQLYEQGKLDLDAPVAHYLPAFAANGKDKITIRELMTHYSGLPEDVSLKDDWGLATPDKAEGIRRAMASVPYGPPGLTFKYSDINFITLGYLVESLSGQPLDEYAHDHIFGPVGMTRTRYLPIAKVCGEKEIFGSAIAPPLGTPIPNSNQRLCSGIWSCVNDSWIPCNWLPLTAPTAYDDQGTPATNPDFDHLLRGTVHDPTTRRMGGVAGHAGVFSTAHDMSLFAQALLDKLLHNTGPFPLKQSTLQLATSPQAPSTAVATATIFLPNGQTSTGVAQRGLGWDLNSPFSRPRGAIFPITTTGHPGSFGHTGFTGTSLWIDPTSDTYVILLANAVHPRVIANISPLRSQVATAVARALGLPTTGAPSFEPHPKGGVSSEARPSSLTPATAPDHTLTGIDVLESTNFAALKALPHAPNTPLRLGLLTNQSGTDAHGARTIDILAHASADLALTTLFTPEHGLFARQDTEHLASETDPATHLPVISVYGPKASDKHPKQADLRDLDAVLIDLPDAGVPFWTYETLTGYFLESCSRAHVSVVILDRPNPIGGLAVQGPTADPGTQSYFNFTPIPLRHGLTLGELARYFNAYAVQSPLDPRLLDGRAVVLGVPDNVAADGGHIAAPATQPGLHASLTVLPMQNWTRAEFFDQTGLAWIPPSPNMKSPATNIVYPGVALMEYTNMSVGRGSPAPYENFGAPFINAAELAAYLEARHIPGITFTASTLAIAETPEHYPFHGQTIPAIHLTVTDRTHLDSPEMGVELLSALHHLYPTQFQLEKAKVILLNAATLEAIKHDQDPREIADAWRKGILAFEASRRPYLLYH